MGLLADWREAPAEKARKLKAPSRQQGPSAS
jgi:hypothetical protein